MNSRRVRVFVATLLVLSFKVSAGAAGTPRQAGGGGAATPESRFRAELLRELEGARDKIIALAEATPQEKFSWRPAAGVRSLGEVYMHIAAGNFFVLSYTSVKPPAGLGDVREMEKITDKAKALEMLKLSFEHLRRVVIETPDADLDKPAATKLLGEKSTMRRVFLRLTMHANEHLGQAIAYARMNGVAPPWTGAR